MKYVYALATVVGACWFAVLVLGSHAKLTMIYAILQIASILLVLIFERVLKGKQ